MRNFHDTFEKHKQSIFSVFSICTSVPLSCFVVDLGGIHGNVDICQIDYSIASKLEFSPYP